MVALQIKENFYRKHHSQPKSQVSVLSYYDCAQGSEDNVCLEMLGVKPPISPPLRQCMKGTANPGNLDCFNTFCDMGPQSLVSASMLQKVSKIAVVSARNNLQTQLIILQIEGNRLWKALLTLNPGGVLGAESPSTLLSISHPIMGTFISNYYAYLAF